MSFEMEMPESTDIGGNFLTVAGRYHFGVLDVDEQPTNKKTGELYDGFRVKLSVLEGQQKNHELDLLFFNPGSSDEGTEKGREMAKRKQARFAMATGILPTAASAGQRVTVDLQHARGRQIVAEVEPGKDPKYLQLAWANIWHVDDPAVADVPKSAAAIKLLPAALRRSADSFAKDGGASRGGNGGGGGTAGSSSASVNVDDL